MFKTILTTALLVCSLGARGFDDEPRRVPSNLATSSNYPLDTYFAMEIYNFSGSGNVSLAYDVGDGNLIYSTIPLGDHLSINLPKGLVVYITNEDTTAIHTEGGVFVTYNENSSLVENEKDRIWAQYDYFSAHTSTDLVTRQGMEVNELSSEIYPEMSFDYEVNYDGYSPTWDRPLLEITFQKFFRVSYDAFGCEETEGSSFYKLGSPVTLGFNALTGYGFYLDYLTANNQVWAGNFIDYAVTTDGDLEAPYTSFGSEMLVSVSSGLLNQDVVFRVGAIYLDFEVLGSYADGYDDGVEEGTKPVSWVRSVFNGLVGIFSIEIFPNISLAFLAFAPLLVVAIIAIVRILKHE